VSLDDVARAREGGGGGLGGGKDKVITGVLTRREGRGASEASAGRVGSYSDGGMLLSLRSSLCSSPNSPWTLRGMRLGLLLLRGLPRGEERILW